MSEATNRPLQVDGPVVASILKSLESLQSEARENVRTMGEVRIEMGKIGEKVSQLTTDHQSYSALAEKVARLETHADNMKSEITGMQGNQRWAIGLAVPSFIGMLGLLLTVINLALGKGH